MPVVCCVVLRLVREKETEEAARVRGRQQREANHGKRATQKTEQLKNEPNERGGETQTEKERQRQRDRDRETEKDNRNSRETERGLPSVH